MTYGNSYNLSAGGCYSPRKIPYSVLEAAQYQEADLGQYFALTFKLALYTIVYSHRDQGEEKIMYSTVHETSETPGF